MNCHGIIIGAGIVGSALAAELAARGVSGIHVFDPDLEGGFRGTPRSASPIGAHYANRVDIELSRATLAYLSSVKDQVGFRPDGHLTLYDAASRNDGMRHSALARELGLECEELAVGSVRARYPFLDRLDGVLFGCLDPRGGVVDARALLDHYRRQARERGVTFHDRYWMVGASEVGGGAWAEMVELSSEEEARFALAQPDKIGKGDTAPELWEASFVVFCGGAWTPYLERAFRLSPVTAPRVRRTSILSHGKALGGFGCIVDTSGIFFLPEGADLLAGSLKEPVKIGYSPEYSFTYFERELWPALYARSSAFTRLKHVRGWAAPEAQTSDGSGVIERLPGTCSFFEAHGFGFRGIGLCHGVALATADLVTTGRFETVDASALSRQRFQRHDAARHST